MATAKELGLKIGDIARTSREIYKITEKGVIFVGCENNEGALVEIISIDDKRLKVEYLEYYSDLKDRIYVEEKRTIPIWYRGFTKLDNL